MGAPSVAVEGAEDTPVDPLPMPCGEARTTRMAVAACLAVALLLAAYTGLRLPSTWAVTLQTVPIGDGFFRRFAVGTVLAPVAAVGGYNYWFLAAVSFAVLGILLAIISRATLRTSLHSQRLVVLAWLLLPTGAYAFHVVGYLDQFLYVLLFAAIAGLRRDRAVLASLLLCAAVMVHEIAVLTVLPVGFAVAVRRDGLRRAVVVLAPPVVLSAVILLVPSHLPEAPEAFRSRLADANFPLRKDVLRMFARTQGEALEMYDAFQIFGHLLLVATVLVAAYLGLRAVERSLGDRTVIVDILAIATPALLAFAGWDGSRWIFLLITNFFVVLWLHLGARARELDWPQLIVLITALLMISRFGLDYFDGYAPRPVNLDAAALFVEQVRDGLLTTIPSR